MIKSEEHIISRQSIEHGDVFTATGDYFRRAKGRTSIQSDAKTESYFKIKPKESLPEDLDSSSESSASAGSVESEAEGDFNLEINLETCLDVCVNEVIR